MLKGWLSYCLQAEEIEALNKEIKILNKEVDALEKKIETMEATCKLSIVDIIRNAMEEACKPWDIQVNPLIYRTYNEYSEIRGLLESTISDLVSNVTVKEIAKHYKEKIESEAFIDDVIKRIKRKQIK